jgi:4'-phosphopantetheinyl transferase EntD
VLRLVAGDEEREWLDSAAGPECWDRILFSAKESVFKAWFPLAGRWLGFKDALVTFDPDTGSFAARLLVPGPVTRFDGRFTVRDGLVLTAVAVVRAEA